MKSNCIDQRLGKYYCTSKNYAKQGVDRQVSFAQKTPKGCPGVAPGRFCDCQPRLRLKIAFLVLKLAQKGCININISFLENWQFNHKLAPLLLYIPCLLVLKNLNFPSARNWEKLRSLTRATLKNRNFRSFCKLGKTSEYSLKGNTFMTSAKKVKMSDPLPPVHSHPKLVLLPYRWPSLTGISTHSGRDVSRFSSKKLIMRSIYVFNSFLFY